jgi:hypothetical protein
MTSRPLLCQQSPLRMRQISRTAQLRNTQAHIEDSGILGCDALSSGEWFGRFEGTYCLRLHGDISQLYPVEGNSKFLRSVGHILGDLNPQEGVVMT